MVSLDGKTRLYDTLNGSIKESEKLGDSLAQKLIDQGALKLIERIVN